MNIENPAGIEAWIKRWIREAGEAGIVLTRDDFFIDSVMGPTLDGMPADQWIEAMTS